MSFSLESIKKTKTDNPPRVLIYGPHKIGKSTFASQSESPIFIQTEDGLDAIETDAFPLCQKHSDILDALTSLYQDKHDFKTLVLDSADWAERLVHDKVCEDHNVKGIEHIGYGKGYSFAADLFGEILDGMNALRMNRGMQIIVLCHSEIKTFNDPQSDSYDRYQLKLHKAVGKMLQEWSDIIGFAQEDRVTKVEKEKGFRDGRVRAISTGKRVLHLVGSACYDAGNRYGMKDVAFTWGDFSDEFKRAREGK